MGPIWQGGHHGEAELLTHCYRNALRVAREYSLKTLAFPAISCGVFGYPPDQAARIALNKFGKSEHADLDITVCCRVSDILESYRRAVASGMLPQERVWKRYS